MTLPRKREKPRRHRDLGHGYMGPKVERRFPGHCAFVRRHHCCVPGCQNVNIECAHVDHAGGKGMGCKVPDWFTVSLCCEHHAEYHRGARSFERKYGLDLIDLAEEFYRRSPQYHKMALAREQFDRFYGMST